LSHGPRGLGAADHLGHFPVGSRLPVRDRAEGAPHLLLEGRGRRVKGQVEVAVLPEQVGHDGPDVVAGPPALFPRLALVLPLVPPVLQKSGPWKLAPEFGEKLVPLPEAKGADTFRRGGQHHRANGRGGKHVSNRDPQTPSLVGARTHPQVGGGLVVEGPRGPVAGLVEGLGYV